MVNIMDFNIDSIFGAVLIIVNIFKHIFPNKKDKINTNLICFPSSDYVAYHYIIKYNKMFWAAEVYMSSYGITENCLKVTSLPYCPYCKTELSYSDFLFIHYYKCVNENCSFWKLSFKSVDSLRRNVLKLFKRDFIIRRHYFD